VADLLVDSLCERLNRLRDEHTVLVRSSMRLLFSGAPYPSQLVTARSNTLQAAAWRIAGDLQAAGATDAAFNAVCGWTDIP
jgi:hypothetical protein